MLSHLPGTADAGDTSILECNALLTDTLGYDVADDIPEQRNALIEFYNSTGGANWAAATIDANTRAQITYFETYLVQIGQIAAQANFSISYLSADLQAVFYAVEQLSANCNLQRSLQLVNLLTKYSWNTAGEGQLHLLLQPLLCSSFTGRPPLLSVTSQT